MPKGNPNPAMAGQALRFPRGDDAPVNHQPFDETGSIPTDADFKVRYRKALAQGCTDDDLKFVIERMIECAKRGESWAVKEVMARFAGKPMQPLEMKDTTADRMLSESEALEILKAYGVVSSPPQVLPAQGQP